MRENERNLPSSFRVRAFSNMRMTLRRRLKGEIHPKVFQLIWVLRVHGRCVRKNERNMVTA